MRRAPRRPHAAGKAGRGGNSSRYGPKVDEAYAKKIVTDIQNLRGDTDLAGQNVGPFGGWRDLCGRLLGPLGTEAQDHPQKLLVLLLFVAGANLIRRALF